MDFSLSEEQVMLQDSVDKYVREHCDVERLRGLKSSASGFAADAWQQFADLGWLSVPFAEEVGGFGGGAVDVMVVCEALGKGLVREPYLSTVITCGGFLRRASTEQQSEWLPGIIDGSKCWAFAFAESSSGYDLSAVETTAVADNGSFTINGDKLAVLDGDNADYLVVSARTSGDARSSDGISLFIVDTSADGVERQGFTRVDGGRGAHISFNNVSVDAACLIGPQDGAYELIEAVMDEAIVAMGAEALGAMQVLLDTTVEYTKTRKQFGQPIGKFQALQHRMAEMYLRLEETRSLLFNAAIQLDANSEESAAACAALKVKIGEAGKYVSQQAVQLHGGIGMTDELVVGHHFKRLMVLGMLYGDEDYYLQRYVELTRRKAG
jgi:alkylation response protein AidB-like acyl-CoA dehydrogenase